METGGRGEHWRGGKGVGMLQSNDGDKDDLGMITEDTQNSQ